MDADVLSGKNRQLIPRWHTSRKLQKLSRENMLDFSQHKYESEEGFHLAEAIGYWNSNHTKSNAIEVFAKLRLIGKTSSDEYKEVKEFLVDNIGALSPALSELVQPLSHSIDSSDLYSIKKQTVYEIIAKLKTRLSNYSKDPFTWNDLAFYYAVLGQTSQAKKCMSIALETGKYHPAIARAYSRLILEGDDADPELAISILKKSQKHFNHPFLDSAELAIRAQFSLGKLNISKAKKLIDRFESRPDLITELSAAVATEEILNGNTRNARKNLKIASISPTENTISQIHWLHSHLGVNLDDIISTLAKSVESEAIDLYKAQEYLACRERLMSLHDFQPFSTGSIVGAGFISLTALDDPDFVIEKYEFYEEITSRELTARNNYAVALIEKGNLEKAHKLISYNSQAANEDGEKYLTQATNALYLYRSGNPELGRALYESAIFKFKQLKSFAQVANALFHFGREEAAHNKEQGKKFIKQALEIIKEKNVSLIIKHRAEALLEKLNKTP